MFKVTWRGIRSHALRLLLTVVAVVLSVAFMVGTQVLTATVSASYSQVYDDVYKNVDVVVRSLDVVSTGFGQQRSPVKESLVETIRSIPGVEAAEGNAQGVITILDKAGDPMGNSDLGPSTYGMNWLTNPTLNGWRITSGREPRNSYEVVLDQRTAEKAGYQPGDQVSLSLKEGTKTYTVVGVAGFGSTPDYAGSAAALFDTATAQTLFADPDAFSYISVAGNADLTQEQLRNRVAPVVDPAQAVTGASFTAESQSGSQQVFGFLDTILLVFGIVSLAVGSFIIYNTFTIIVAQSTRDLALLRAMGASRRQVVTGVMVEAALVGVLASAVGLIGGVALAWALTALLALFGFGPPISGLSFPPAAFVVSFLVGVGVTVLAGLIPAFKASRIPPIAAMTDVAVDRSHQSRLRAVVGILALLAGGVLLYLGVFTRGPSPLLKVGVSFGLLFAAVTVLGPVFARPFSAVIAVPFRTLTGRLARRNAMRNPKRTATTTSALMIGVGLIVLFAILVQSIKVTASSSIDSTYDVDFVIGADTSGLTGMDPSLATDAAKVRGVASATGLRVGFAQVANRATVVLGVEPDAVDSGLTVTVVAGDLNRLALDQIAISKDIADNLGVRVGSQLPVKFLNQGVQRMTVGAIYTMGLQTTTMMISHDQFTKLFPAAMNVDNQVFVRLAASADAAAVKANLKALVKSRYPTASVQDIGEYKDSQLGFLNSLLLIITALLILAVLIALLGIFNTLLLSIYERTREIGLIRAVGGSRRQVRASIRWEAVIFSLQGTIIGIVIGFGFAWVLVRAVNVDTPLTFAVPTTQIVGMLVVALLAGLAAAVVPAWRASRTDILAAITVD